MRRMIFSPFVYRKLQLKRGRSFDIGLVSSISLREPSNIFASFKDIIVVPECKLLFPRLIGHNESPFFPHDIFTVVNKLINAMFIDVVPVKSRNTKKGRKLSQLHCLHLIVINQARSYSASHLELETKKAFGSR